MGVGMVLAGVLNLVGNLLSGLGLDSLLKGIMGATVSFIPHSYTVSTQANDVIITRVLTRSSLVWALGTCSRTLRSKENAEDTKIDRLL